MNEGWKKLMYSRDDAEMPLVILSAQSAKLDDDAVLILGNRACQAATARQ